MDEVNRSVPVVLTPKCRAYTIPSSASGRPVLVIDYGHKIEFQVDDPPTAELFALGLAMAALVFASRCYALRGGHHVD